MKELSIKEKAKRYDEALWKAGELYQPSYSALLEEIFPELIKYNNEKVRGAIIHFISHTPTVPIGRINKETMLTWLEKQKTSEETIISQHENKICKENNDSLTSEDARIKKYLLSMFPDPNDSWDGISAREIIAWLEKQGQTFTKKDVDDAWLKGMCDAKHELEKQCGQNSTWSEEDEKMVNNILTPLAGRFPWNIYQPMYDWLKALKGRVQPKQRWSEEDASRLEEVMCMIEANGRWVRSDDAVKSVLDWLKSLQQRIGE